MTTAATNTITAANTGGGGGGYGGYVSGSTSVTPLTAVYGTAGTYTIPPGASWTIAPGGAGMTWTTGRMTDLYPPVDPPPVLRGRTLTPEDLSALAERYTACARPGETLIVTVEEHWTAGQIANLEREMLARPGFPEGSRMLVMRAARVTPAQAREAVSLARRLDVLARIGIVWEDHPGMSLGEILAVLLALPEGQGDETLVRALEAAWA